MVTGNRLPKQATKVVAKAKATTGTQKPVAPQGKANTVLPTLNVALAKQAKAWLANNTGVGKSVVPTPVQAYAHVLAYAIGAQTYTSAKVQGQQIASQLLGVQIGLGCSLHPIGGPKGPNNPYTFWFLPKAKTNRVSFAVRFGTTLALACTTHNKATTASKNSLRQCTNTCQFALTHNGAWVYKMLAQGIPSKASTKASAKAIQTPTVAPIATTPTPTVPVTA